MIKTMFAAAIAALLAAPAAAEDWDFVLVNNTGKPIKSIEISAGGANEWVANKADPEMKRAGMTAPGGRTTVHFDKNPAKCRHDVQATFADNSSAAWRGINVCDNAYVTISFANGAPVFKAN